MLNHLLFQISMPNDNEKSFGRLLENVVDK